MGPMAWNLGKEESMEGLKEMPKGMGPMSLKERLARDFTYHSPKGDQPKRYEAIREKAKELALLIADLTPNSREQSLAFTKLDEVVMHANSAIARNE